jgi:PAS domain S-box-containing protein
MINSKLGSLLFVDDEIESLTPSCDLLSEWGYKVVGFTSGKDALEALKKQDFDLLLTDLMMPEMDGLELMKAALELEPHLVCIIITGKGTIQTGVEAMKLGAFDYILKPIEWKILRPILSRAMEMRRLREAGEKYRSIVEDYQTELICRFLPEGTFTFVNKAYCRYFNKKCEELIGQSFMQFVLEEDHELIRQSVASLSMENPVMTIEHRVFAPNDEIRWQQWTNRAIFNKQGQILEFQSVGRDITEQKRAEEALLVYQEQLRASASRLSSTEERERRRIAADLHDRIGQTLAVSKMKLGALLESASSSGFGGTLKEIHELIGQAIQDTRSLIFDLSPPVLYELGFEAAAESLAEQIQEQQGILIDFYNDAQPKPMSDELRILLFKTLRELLINIVKHAQAQKAKVSLKREDDNIQITVEDEGVGFDASKIDPYGKTIRFGLFNIRERLESIGGDVVVESKPGYGTRVTLVAPLILVP